MSFLSDELKTQRFRCPNCLQIISELDKNCRFCSLQITDDIKIVGIKKEREEVKKAELSWHRNILIGGLVFFIIGVLMFASTVFSAYFSNAVNVSCLMPICLIGGVVATIKGWIGYNKTKKEL
jgi:hypothetical protein